MIGVDLHLHTTASDGRCTPAELVDRAYAANLAVIAVTDHDTTNAITEVQRRGQDVGIDVVTGIEITAMTDGRDMHLLGYFFDLSNSRLTAFLETQRANRVARVIAIGERLAALGVPIDMQPLLDLAHRETGRSLGRPLIARAMVVAGHVATVQEAFDKWLAHGQPAFLPRSGPQPEETIAILHDAGGLVSVAHPGASEWGHRIPSLADAGLDAIEVFHSDHDGAMVDHYLAMARDLDLLVTGGSDFHGNPEHGLDPGSVLLPPEEWSRVREAASRRRP